MPDIRKTLPQLIAELDQVRHLTGKVFRHLKSGDKFTLLFFSFDESTNDMNAVYCFTIMPRIKFHCPVDHFIDGFEQEHG